MKNIILELSQYRRFHLNQINTFKYTPKNDYQLILGTNGSGKTSLIEELSPLPGHVSKFNKDGYKKITFDYRQNHYELTSIFGSKQIHSFIKNYDEELNPSGLITIQKDLVKSEFGITDQIHDMMIGSTTFTRMSPSERRQWFSLMGNKDYDYALNVYKKIQEYNRDVTGALKRNKKLLVEETDKLLKEEEIIVLKNEINELTKIINILMENKPKIFSNDRTEKDIDLVKEVCDAEITNHANKILKTKIQLNNFPFNIEYLNDSINKTIQDINVNELFMKKIAEEYMDLEKQYSKLNIMSSDSITKLTTHKKELEKELNNHINDCVYIKNIDNPELALNSLKTIFHTLSDIVIEIKSNSDNYYSKSNYQELVLKHDKIIELKTNIEKELEQWISRKNKLEAFKEKGITECPKCAYNWIIGFDQKKYDDAIKSIDTLTEKYKKINKELTDIKTKINDYEEYSKLITQYKQCTNSANALNILWDYLLENKILQNTPKDILNIINIATQDLTKLIAVEAIMKELEGINNTLNTINLTDKENYEKIQESLEKKNNEVLKYTEEITTLKKNLNYYKTLKTNIELLLNRDTLLNNNLREKEELFNEKIKLIRVNVLTDLISNFQQLLAHKTTTLNKIEHIKVLVNNLILQIKKLEEEELASKQLLLALSPTEGIIAEGMLGYIRNFTVKMNTLINKVWNYSLEILPCSIEEGESLDLDYKFPMYVKDTDQLIPDISKGSGGIKEVIDLAFKVIAMSELGLGDFPLFLDEFGIKFDEYHRDTANSVIQSLMQEHHFSYLFMISHSYRDYDNINDAEILILDSRNITIPTKEKYNQHVEML